MAPPYTRCLCGRSLRWEEVEVQGDSGPCPSWFIAECRCGLHLNWAPWRVRFGNGTVDRETMDMFATEGV